MPQNVVRPFWGLPHINVCYFDVGGHRAHVQYMFVVGMSYRKSLVCSMLSLVHSLIICCSLAMPLFCTCMEMPGPGQRYTLCDWF